MGGGIAILGFIKIYEAMCREEGAYANRLPLEVYDVMEAGQDDRGIYSQDALVEGSFSEQHVTLHPCEDEN